MSACPGTSTGRLFFSHALIFNKNPQLWMDTWQVLRSHHHPKHAISFSARLTYLNRWTICRYILFFIKIAPVAQWIERQPPELKAAGSSPAGRTINKIANLGSTLKLAFFMLMQHLGRNIYRLKALLESFLMEMRPLKIVQFYSSSRKAKILICGIH